MAVSKAVRIRIEEYNQIKASLNTHLPQSVGIVVKKSESNKNPERNVTEEQLLGSVYMLLETADTAAEVMTKADEEYNREIGEDTEKRTKLNDMSELCYKTVRDFKLGARPIHGQGFIESIQLEGKTPRNPVDQIFQINLLIAWMSNPDKVIPPPVSLFLPPLNKEQILNHMLPVQQKLNDAITASGNELKETEGTMIAKNLAIDEYDSCVSALTGVCYHLMMLADMTEAAERLYPHVQRSRTKPDVPDSPNEDIETPEPTPPE